MYLWILSGGGYIYLCYWLQSSQLFFLIVNRIKGVEKAFRSIAIITVRNVVNFNFRIIRRLLYLKMCTIVRRRTRWYFSFFAKYLFNGLIRFSVENVTISKITSIKLLKRRLLVWWIIIDLLNLLMLHTKFIPVYMKNSLLRLNYFKFWKKIKLHIKLTNITHTHAHKMLFNKIK